MVVSLLVRLSAAAVMSAIQWAALFSAPLHTQSLQPVGAPVAVEALDASLPVVVVSAHRNLQHVTHRHFLAGGVDGPEHRRTLLHLILDRTRPSGVSASRGEKYWLDKLRTPAYLAWAGYSFENLCLTQVPWIERALQLDHIGYEVGSWNHSPPKGRATQSGAQIELLFNRSDDIESLCETKFNTEVFALDKPDARDAEVIFGRTP